MSVVGVFSKGRPAGHPSATSILRYVPRPRVPWQPSRFGRQNLDEEDLTRLWGRGRYREGPGNYNSGYSTEKTKVLEDNTLHIIPKHELEKFMPDISLGPKALVTPVSLMSARNGHRVTHDLLHSYDPYIGRVQAPAVVDHENITVQDPNRVGLNAATLDCRGRIYRWLRRGPFFQEDHYFRRSTRVNRDGSIPVSAHEASLVKKVVRLAHRGHLKSACEEYRRITSIPPVQVYRALTSACIPGAKLADAIAIFEDGNARLFYVARDGEVLHNLMLCAIRAKHRVRVMWVYNTMRGRHYENTVVRSEVDVIWQYRIASLALEYLLDHNAAEEAREIYTFLVEAKLVDCDLQIRLGQAIQKALSEGKQVHAREEAYNGIAMAQNAVAVAPQVAAAIYQRYAAILKENPEASHAWTSAVPMTDPSQYKDGAVAWLEAHFADINPLAVMRLARFRKGQKDLMATDRAAYVARAAAWMEQLSVSQQTREEAPLTYFRKSRPSITNEAVRVAWLPERRRPHQLLPHDEGFVFSYNGPQTRFVDETFASSGNTLQEKYLARQPLHTEVESGVSFGGLVAGEKARKNLSAQQAIQGRISSAPARVLHSSVFSGASGGAATSASSSPAAQATESADGAKRPAMDDDKMF